QVFQVMEGVRQKAPAPIILADGKSEKGGLVVDLGATGGLTDLAEREAERCDGMAQMERRLLDMAKGLRLDAADETQPFLVGIDSMRGAVLVPHKEVLIAAIVGIGRVIGQDLGRRHFFAVFQMGRWEKVRLLMPQIDARVDLEKARQMPGVAELGLDL